MPENSLDSLLPNSKLAKGAEDGSFLQPSLGDSVEQYQPGSFPIAALGLDIIQQRPSIPVDSVQRDQSNSIQVALEDSIRPISGISQANSNYDTSSNLYPNKLDGSNLLANGPTDQKVPNEPIIPPLLFQIIEKVCPSFVLPARACCQGSTQGVTKLPTNIPPNSAAKIFDLFKDMILTSTFVEECYPCTSLPKINSRSY